MALNASAALLAATFVLANSVLGLIRVLEEFVNVWTSSFIGDVVFVAGSVGVLYVAWRMMGSSDPRVAWAAAPVAFLLDWTVYAAAWTFTGEMPLAFSFVMEVGWPGLVMVGTGTLVWTAAQQDQRRIDNDALSA